MTTIQLNKYAAAILLPALGILSLSIIAEIIYTPEHAEEPGYVIAVAETGEEGALPSAPLEVLPIGARLQVASAAAGETSAKKCAACHTFDQGSPAKVGPNLWGVVGGPAAHMEGFNYSNAMREKAAEGLTWTYDNLDHFLANPKGFIPGTAMAFIGLKKPDERANVIAYLRTLSTDPVPLPPPPPPPAETAATESGGTPAATESGGTGDTSGAGDSAPAATETPAMDSGAPPAATSDGATPPASGSDNTGSAGSGEASPSTNSATGGASPAESTTGTGGSTGESAQ